MQLGKIFLIIIATIALLFFFWWQYRTNIAKRRSKEMAFLRVVMARKDSDSDEKKETIRDFKEQISLMEQLLSNLKSLYRGNFLGWLLGQEYISFEYTAHANEIYFYIVVPRKSKLLVEKQIIGFYPDCLIEETSEINIFENRKSVLGEAMILKKGDEFPIRTYQKLESDSMNAILSALGRLSENTSATIQILLKPEDDNWQNRIKKMIRKEEKNPGKRRYISFNPLVWMRGFLEIFFQDPEEKNKKDEPEIDEKDPIDDEGLMKEKVKKTGFLVMVRVIVTADDDAIANAELRNIISSFSQFASPAYNRFRPMRHKSLSVLIQYFILRQFAWWQKNFLLNIEEIATLFHFPHSKYNKQPEIKWQHFRVVKAPTNIPHEGLYLGDNIFRGERRKIYLSNEDRFRHFYVIGQTGTGKSSILSVMARQDLRNGRGLAVLDPHGDFATGLLDFIPKTRAEDLIFFDPADQGRPMGLNLLEADTDDEKQMAVSEATSIMIKIFGPEIFGPRIQDYFRNGCLALMDYPEGGTLIELIKLFTDENFQRERVQTIKNPIVKTWWKTTYAAMGDREKAEMIPFFAAKFGPFITNTLMRNIIGQTKSAFDITDVMNTQKILLATLSKGVLGDINSSLIGLILVSKIQMAAMKRQQMPASERKDFFLYIDEFQNYVTDSIESILSEARKYRLGLIIAHQYLGQLQKSDALTKSSLNLKDAIFGNVGSMMSYKIGPEDAKLLEEQFAPVYSNHDFMNMDKFQAALRLSVDGQPSQGFSLDVPRPWLEK
jgi:hypothetical protein cdiviTM7_01505